MLDHYDNACHMGGVVLAHFQRLQTRNAAQDFGSVSPAKAALVRPCSGPFSVECERVVSPYIHRPRGLLAGRTDATRCRKRFTSLPRDLLLSLKLGPTVDYQIVISVDTYTSVAALVLLLLICGN
ncbi:hypothetical protein J6590_081059 [Homalodisca vitripennis]|nr:hypothetical protein J6590_081059 [Homalodisca vitripennis]